MLTAKPSPTLSFQNPSSNLHFFHPINKHPSSHILRSIPLSTPTLTLTPTPTPSQTRVEILSESLPYIQKFRGKTIVVKYGGAAMKSESLQDSVIKDLVLLSCVGIRPVLVHGGGPEINIWLNKVNIQPHFLNGLRVTDAATMEIVQMVLVGKVNKGLVSLINKAGATAVGLAGIDGYLLTARQKSVQLGFVGDITFNINADTVAGEIAAALGAEKLILLTDIAGILEDKNDPSTLVKQIDIKGVKRMVEDGKVAGGMIPKVNCCVRSLAQGVRTTSIIDGRVKHSLLTEVLTDEGAGTMITG
ncbi:hypothetical protein IFM89_001771 [Coptis chinensis]|uniref:Aspartate/glutamate/uridylate kinase domain-containing protein n=1 Tax=Coptis chinensis TaxID=261450 RepID=A0A835HFU8_9MAGN|nr:hypothetical protein IFM89_001771 [Coptis chinensis]